MSFCGCFTRPRVVLRKVVFITTGLIGRETLTEITITVLFVSSCPFTCFVREVGSAGVISLPFRILTRYCTPLFTVRKVGGPNAIQEVMRGLVDICWQNVCSNILRPVRTRQSLVLHGHGTMTLKRFEGAVLTFQRHISITVVWLRRLTGGCTIVISVNG